MSIGQIRQRFNQRANHYDNPLATFLGERELRQIRRLVPPSSTVLDYGCGTGRTTLDLLRRGCTVTAYDISAEMLAIARTRASQAGFTACFTTDPEQLAGVVWPVITLIGVLDYYPDPSPIFSTLIPLLTPGGTLVATIPNALSPLSWIYAAGSRLTCPATPRSIGFIHRQAARAGLRLIQHHYAFPAIPFIGYTLVMSFTRPESGGLTRAANPSHEA
jgi:2-polyprenyl-3-methyl-5-hydroxy-6-metoxy-1,4-benzoquinol methylase